MNEKINLQELIVLLSKKSGITKKEAELFLKECFETINEALLVDQSVKVKNLGSFKLSSVNARESVDVVTGERVLIPAHYKATFSAENSLAQIINEPFSYFEPVELNEDNTLNSEETIVFVDNEEDTEEEDTESTGDNDDFVPDRGTINFDNPDGDFELIGDDFKLTDGDFELIVDDFKSINGDFELIEDDFKLTNGDFELIENFEITGQTKEPSMFEIKNDNFKISDEALALLIKEKKTTEAYSSKPEITKPEIIKPEIIKPEITEPEFIKPEPIKSQDTKQENVEPDYLYYQEKKNLQSSLKKLLNKLIIPLYFILFLVVALFFFYLYSHPEMAIFQRKTKQPTETKNTHTGNPREITPENNIRPETSISEEPVINDSLIKIIEKYAPGKLDTLLKENPDIKIKPAIEKKNPVEKKIPVERKVPVEKKNPVEKPVIKNNPVDTTATANKTTTIRNGETLTRIAEREYGSKWFWVYLYEENKNVIKDIHSILVGTTITIPPAEKYNIDNNDPESVRRARALASQFNGKTEF